MRAVLFIAVITLSAIALSGVTARFLFALAGPLTSPGVAVAADYPADARKKVMSALRRRDCKFVGGWFVNSRSFLRYTGDAGSLNRFIGDLLECPEVTVTVAFKKRNDKCDWHVAHDASTNRFRIQVNLNSKGIDLEKLILPAAKGPKRKGR